MACDLTLGRLEPCKDFVGGIKTVYFINFGEAVITLGVDSEVTAIDDGAAGTVAAFQYDLKGGSMLEQNINSSRDNGTTFVEQIVTLMLKHMTKEDNAELMILSYGRPLIIVHDYNGDAWLVGRQLGAEVTGGTAATGTLLGDLTGYNLTLTGNEKMFANYIEGSTEADPFADAAIDVTPTVGT